MNRPCNIIITKQKCISPKKLSGKKLTQNCKNLFEVRKPRAKLTSTYKQFRLNKTFFI